MATLTTVVNIKTDPYDVLIDRTTIFGNPSPEWKFGRAGCIRGYRTYFYERLERDPGFRASVQTLMGLVIGCHCKPLCCHGDVIADYLNAQDFVARARAGLS